VGPEDAVARLIGGILAADVTVFREVLEPPLAIHSAVEKFAIGFEVNLLPCYGSECGSTNEDHAAEQKKWMPPAATYSAVVRLYRAASSRSINCGTFDLRFTLNGKSRNSGWDRVSTTNPQSMLEQIRACGVSKGE
jgi:hypothetical protein